MLKVWAHTSTTNIMKSFLNEALNYINKLNEEISTLKDDLVETADLYFKRDKEHVAFFHPRLDLSWMNLFKVVWEGQLVDNR